MTANTTIEWTDATFNPWWGCTKISPGCDHCYAEGIATRFAPGIWGAHGDRREFGDNHWRRPENWNRAAERAGVRMHVFVASMADWADNHAIAKKYRPRLFRLIEDTPWLDWQMLTKRVGNVEGMVPEHWLAGRWPNNAWLGISVVNQEEADRDIPKLRRLPAPVRFLSCEPLLGPIDFEQDGLFHFRCPNEPEFPVMDPTTGVYECCNECDYTGIGSELAIHWVIAGGESGRAARPMHPDWARSLRDQCSRASVPFLFKQWGEFAPNETSEDHILVYRDGYVSYPGFCAPSYKSDTSRTAMALVGKRAAGRLLDGREHNEFPVLP